MKDKLISELKFLEGDGNDNKVDGNYWRDILSGILSRHEAEQGEGLRECKYYDGVANKRSCELPTPDKAEDIVLWEGLVKTGEPGLNLFKGHGEYESTVLFSVDYAKLKGQKGQLIFRKHGEAK